MIVPRPTLGLRHLALLVKDLEACEGFYVSLLGMAVEWRPDPDNVYLTSGHDNLALHRAPAGFAPGTTVKIQEADQHKERLLINNAQEPAISPQHLDHIGFIVGSPEQVDVWYDFLRAHDVPMKTAPRTHRDGARSFYCLDPEGINVQMIYHPPLSKYSA